MVLRILPGTTYYYLVLPSTFWYYRVLPGTTKYYLSTTEYYLSTTMVIPGTTMVIPGTTMVIPCTTWYYHVLPGTTMYYHSSTWYYQVLPPHLYTVLPEWFAPRTSTGSIFDRDASISIFYPCISGEQLHDLTWDSFFILQILLLSLKLKKEAKGEGRLLFFPVIQAFSTNYGDRTWRRAYWMKVITLTVMSKVI